MPAELVRDDDNGLVIRLSKGTMYDLDADLPPPYNAPPQELIKILQKREATTTADEESEWPLHLRNYQIRACNFIAKNRRVLLNIACGLGKTIIACAFIDHILPQKTLIIAPSSLKSNWSKEIKTWTKSPSMLVLKNGSQIDNLTANDMPDITIVSYSLFSSKAQSQCFQASFECLICDEGHSLKHASSKRSKEVKKIAKKTKYCIMLSGTPCERHELLFNLLNILDPKTFQQFYPYSNIKSGTVASSSKEKFFFAERYTVPETVYTSHGRVLTFRQSIRHRELGLLCEPYVFSCTREQANVDLPELNKNHVIIGRLNEEEQKMEERRWSKIDRLKESGKDAKMEIMKIIRESAQTKAAYIQKHLPSRISAQKNTRDPILVFFYHRCVMSSIVDTLEKAGESYVTICGETTMKQRAKRLQQVAKGEAKYAVLSLGTCATGLNLQFITTCWFAELSFDSVLMSQALYRIHRIGSKKPCSVEYWLVDGSIDKKILSSNASRKRNHNSLAEKTAGFA